ncbi:MAG TPA: AgmX/PglI C-terminal domain-containing protein [Anaeromyxobacteraceae bacterium]|nr:AgmX/PglI C-terminal domain-containing protein [Anaeromyxobacteraceae bacterium]
MKFSCDRCGKKYATAETPAPGRVYKLKCKACGHLIVVKTPAAGPAVTPSAAKPPPSDERASTAPAPPPPEVEVEVEAPPQDAPPDEIPESPQVPSSAGEPTAEISMWAGEEPKPQPAAAEGGYVDIFADSAASAPSAGPVEDDPFLKAARGSLPDHFAGGDPFSGLRAEIEAPQAAPEPPRQTHELPPPSAFAPPPRASEDKKKSSLPVALIGIGFAVVVGIVVIVAVTSGKKAPLAPVPAPVAAAPVAAPTPPPAPPAAPATKVAEPKKEEPKRVEPAPRPRREERREEKKVAKVEPKPPPPPPPPPPKAEPKPEPKPVAKAEPAKPVELPDAASALSPAAVQKVVNASRRAFEACIEQAAKKGTDATFDGRKVALRLNVNPNGFVTYPTLDDVTLNRTDLGECLKSAARLMVFPKFQGDVFHVEVPLTLRGG